MIHSTGTPKRKTSVFFSSSVNDPSDAAFAVSTRRLSSSMGSGLNTLVSTTHMIGIITMATGAAASIHDRNGIVCPVACSTSPSASTLMEAPAGVAIPPMNIANALPRYRHFARLDFPFTCPAFSSTVSANPRNSTSVAESFITAESSPPATMNASTSLRESLPAIRTRNPVKRIARSDFITMAVSENTAIAKITVVVPKPEKTVLISAMPSRGASTRARRPVTPMGSVSHIHIATAANSMASPTIPSWVSPSIGGRNHPTTRMTSARGMPTNFLFTLTRTITPPIPRAPAQSAGARKRLCSVIHYMAMPSRPEANGVHALSSTTKMMAGIMPVLNSSLAVQQLSR